MEPIRKLSNFNFQSRFTKWHLTHEIFRILPVFSQFLWTLTFISSGFLEKFSMVLLQITNDIYSPWKKKLKNPILFKLFWYKVFVYWRLKLLNFPNVFRLYTLAQIANCVFDVVVAFITTWAPSRETYARPHASGYFWNRNLFLLESAFCPQEASHSAQRNRIFLKPLSSVCVYVCVFFFLESNGFANFCRRDSRLFFTDLP